MKFKIARLSLIVITCLLTYPLGNADVIDNMDSTSGWTFSNAGGVTGAYGLATGDPADLSTTSIGVTFDLSNGDWLQFGKTGFGTPDFSGGDSIALSYRGEGSNNNIEVKMIDSDGDIFVRTLSKATNTNGNWSVAVMPLTGFSLWADGNGIPFGNGTMNWESISNYNIGITSSAGGDGYLEVDELQTYQANTPGNQSIDDCKSVNAFQGTGNSSVQTVSLAVVNTDPSGDAAANPSVVANNHYYITYVSTALAENNYIICVGEILAPTVSSTTYSYLNFYMKLGTGAEKLHIEFVATGGEANNRIDLSAGTYAASTSWQFISIPLTAFGVIPGNIASIKWVAEPTDLAAVTRSLYMDRIWLSTSRTPVLGSGPIKLMNGFEEEVNKYNYPWSGDRDSQMVLSSVPGLSGNALHIDYAFNQGQWMLVQKGTGLNCATGKGFRFKVKGTGVPQNLEFKIKDKNNTEFIKKFYNFTNTGGEWKTATALNKEFSLFGKGNNGASSLDLKNIGSISFAVSRNKSTSGGVGAVLIDTLETITEDDFTTDRPGHMLSSINIDNNPFSPNGDGIKDLAVFAYTLTDYAHVYLDIYDLAGQVVNRLDGGDMAPGAHSTLKWDGLDSGGNRVRNGLYIYKLRAKNPDNQQDSVTNLIEVLK
jgi:hypothetical protein